jgi:hypothetical protein
MTTNPPAGDPNPWSHPTSGYPDPTSGYNPGSGYPNPTSGYPNPTSGYPDPTTGAGYPADQSAYQQQPYPAAGYQQPGYGLPGYQQPGAWGTPYPPTRPTNGLAIGALVVSVAALPMCGGAAGIVGALMGHSARKQIRERGEGGEGLATGAFVVGWIFVFAIANSGSSSSTY